MKIVIKTYDTEDKILDRNIPMRLLGHLDSEILYSQDEDLLDTVRNLPDGETVILLDSRDFPLILDQDSCGSISRRSNYIRFYSSSKMTGRFPVGDKGYILDFIDSKSKRYDTDTFLYLPIISINLYNDNSSLLGLYKNLKDSISDEKVELMNFMSKSFIFSNDLGSDSELMRMIELVSGVDFESIKNVLHSMKILSTLFLHRKMLETDDECPIIDILPDFQVTIEDNKLIFFDCSENDYSLECKSNLSFQEFIEESIRRDKNKLIKKITT